MADETERVEYSFEGNVSSLRSATQAAINMLNKYSDSMKRASGTDAFSASQRSTKSMNASISRLTKDVTKMQEKLRSVGDVKLPTGSAASKAMESTLTAINSQMQKLGTTGTITTKTLTNFKTQLESVRSSLQASAPQVERLISSEQRFQRILGSVQEKASKFSGAMFNMRNSLQNVFQPVTHRLASFSSVFDGISAKVQSFKDRANTAFSRVGQVIKTVSAAFRRTSQTANESGDSANKSARAHRGLKNTIDALSSGFKKESKAITDEKSLLDSKDSTLKASKTSHNKLLAVLRNLGEKFKTESKNVNIFGTNLKKLNTISGALTGSFKSAIAALTGIELGDWLSQASTSAITFIENLNLFKVAMGSSIDKGMQFVDTMQEIYGMDPSNLYRYSGYFYQLTAAIGMSDTASASLSLSMTKMANDIASLFNVDIATVVDNLASGIQGMSRAVRKYGMDIRATTLQQTALKYGLTEQVETMSEANRMALRYITMMEQASNAVQQTGKDVEGAATTMGDFARNIETPANQLRIFKEQMSQLGRAIGNFIVAPLAKAIAYINGFLMALRMAINFVAGILGVLNSDMSSIDVSGAEDASDALDNIGSSAGSASEKIKDLIAPFDELNVLQEQTASGGGGGGAGAFDDVLDPALEAAISNLELKLENIKMKANEVRDAILEFFGFKVDAGEIISWDPEQFEANLIEKFPYWTKTIQALFDNWSKIIEGFKAVFKSIGRVVDIVFKKIKKFLSLFINDDTASAFIEGLGDSLQSLADWITAHEDTLANLVLMLSAVFLGFKAFKALEPVITVISNFGSALAGVAGPLAEVIGVAALVAGAIYLLYTNSESFAESFKNLLDDFWRGLTVIWDSLKVTLTTIGEGILSLWKTSIKPTITAIGDAIAPVLDTIGELWLLISDIIADAADIITQAWKETLQPVLEDIFEGIQTLCGILKTLWNEVLGPIISYISQGVSKLWESTIKPIVEKVIKVLGKLIEVIMMLWNDYIGPFVNWIIDTLGPSILNVLKTIWGRISTVFEGIGNIIDDLLTALDGLLDFIGGVFTGDWDRAWKGIVNILVGVGNAIISVFELALNAVISLINAAISFIYNAIVGLVNLILGAVEGIASWFGADWDITITGKPPAIPTVSIPRIPEMAAGGIITSPTYLLAGEGRYDEAIIPLGNSPQMEELVQRIADAVDKPDDKSSGNTPIEVRVFIGGEEYDAFTYRAAERGRKKVGAQPVTTGG